MNKSTIEIQWPNGKKSIAKDGSDWLALAKESDILIPTGCLGGNCGACEIEVNGEVVRACINNIPFNKGEKLIVDFYSPFLMKNY